MNPTINAKILLVSLVLSLLADVVIIVSMFLFSHQTGVLGGYLATDTQPILSGYGIAGVVWDGR